MGAHFSFKKKKEKKFTLVSGIQTVSVLYYKCVRTIRVTFNPKEVVTFHGHVFSQACSCDFVRTTRNQALIFLRSVLGDLHLRELSSGMNILR